MISTIEEFERKLNTLDPGLDDFVLQADDLIAALSPDLAAVIFEPIFRFFEAHATADCGAPGTLVHHVEDFYPNYVIALRESVRRAPSYNGVLMINRILNSKISSGERTQYLEVLTSVLSNRSTPDNVRSMAQRYLDLQG